MDEITLRRDTEKHWQDNIPENLWSRYLSIPYSFNLPLLFAEIENAQKAHPLPVKRAEGIIRKLVILVGESFEPLLQSILAYQPDIIYAVLSEQYGDINPIMGQKKRTGSMQWEELKVRIDQMEMGRQKFFSEYGNKKWKVPEVISIFVEDKEQDVFERLLTVFGSAPIPENEEVFVDITGAKKTMVAGAFLYAAYTGAEIRYVDFTAFCKERNRPYGYSCNFREVTNLYQKLHLHNWERAESLYEKYDFQSALQTLPDDYSTPDIGYSDLKNFVLMCSAWDNGGYWENDPDGLPEWKQGGYRQAGNLYQLLEPSAQQIAPRVIVELANSWPALGSDGKIAHNQIMAFLTNPAAVAWYAKDELLRAQRQAGGSTRVDPRGAFTRAYSIHETLVTARLALLVKKGTIHKNGKTISINDDKAWLELESLYYSKKIALLKGNVDAYRRCDKTPGYSALSVYDDSAGESLSRARNYVVHGWRPVTRQQDAILLAKENFENYLAEWAADLPTETRKAIQDEASYRPPEWNVLVHACGASFIPVIRRTKLNP